MTLSATSYGMTRRRFIAITAAAAALTPRTATAAATSETLRWQGVALGAEASLILQHPDRGAAAAALDASLAEVARLEAIFSLYRPDSALQTLNARGFLDNSPADLRVLLAASLRLAEQSSGAFDPTIQPLWSLYARHFSSPAAAHNGPERQELAAARALIGWRNVLLDGANIRLGLPGMALTLNGIAQGYITDKVGTLLKNLGFEHVLINLGETLALGPKAGGEAWRAAIANPTQPTENICEVSLSEGAMATSGGYGMHFDAAGHFTHILDPNSGAPAQRWASVTVLAPTATLADGLSTALSVAPDVVAPALLGSSASAFVVSMDGRTRRWL
jgi:thiamine biosynthesis lipoprotein